MTRTDGGVRPTYHREVEEFFGRIEALPSGDKDRRLHADQATMELVRHSVAEEAYLYPAVREHVAGGDATGRCAAAGRGTAGVRPRHRAVCRFEEEVDVLAEARGLHRPVLRRCADRETGFGERVRHRFGARAACAEVGAVLEMTAPAVGVDGHAAGQGEPVPVAFQQRADPLRRLEDRLAAITERFVVVPRLRLRLRHRRLERALPVPRHPSTRHSRLRYGTLRRSGSARASAHAAV